jgi:hypothetical protein
MITGLVIILAVALLGRIIPYSKQIRGMQDGLQSYYTARSQLELANQAFANATQRKHIPINGRINEVNSKIELTLPNANTSTYAIIAGASQIPSQISFSPGESPISFGTSTSPTYHFISRNS